MRLLTLMYHYVRPATELQHAGYGGLDTQTFEMQLDELAGDLTPVDWPAVHSALAGGPELPTDAVLLTFDDGLADHARYVLPCLAARGLSAMFFTLARSPGAGLTLGHQLHALIARLGGDTARAMIVARLPDAERTRHAALEARALEAHPDDPEDAWKRPLQREMARVAAPALSALIAENIGREDELARVLYLDETQLMHLVDAGMYLGGHGSEHLWLDHEDQPSVRAELAASTALLTRVQPGPWAFAYPYGGVNESVAEEVKRAGFRAAYTTVWASHGPFRLGRVDGESIGRRRLRDLAVE